MSAVLCPLSLQTLFRDGRPMVGARIFVFEAGTTTPKTVYRDPIMQAAHPRPILTDAQGMVPPIYVGRGDYKLRILSPGNIVISELDGLAGSTAAADMPDPGQSYPLTDASAILLTGDIIAAFRAGTKAGFARCNGNTIGNALSAATEIPCGAASDKDQPVGSAFNLFTHLWELQESGIILPVYANGVEVQRGKTAISDWDNNRQVGLPDFRGRALAGIDGMGAPTANRLQFSRDLTTTKGSIDAYVPDISGIVAGMQLTGTGVMDGTIIKAMDGTHLTLSLPATATTTASTKFSQFGDAGLLGSVGGDNQYTLSTGQLPPHNHPASTSIANNGSHQHSGATDQQGTHQHQYTDVYISQGAVGAATGSAAGAATYTKTTDPAGNHSHNFITAWAGDHAHAASTTISNTGSGQSYTPIQPSILLTWYIKL